MASRRDRLSAALYREAMKSPSHKPPVGIPVFALLLLAAVPGHEVGPWSARATAPTTGRPHDREQPPAGAGRRPECPPAAYGKGTSWALQTALRRVDGAAQPRSARAEY